MTKGRKQTTIVFDCNSVNTLNSKKQTQLFIEDNNMGDISFNFQSSSYKAKIMDLQTPSIEDLIQKEQERENHFENGSS